MARLVSCLLAFIVASSSCDPVKNVTPYVDAIDFANKQIDILLLHHHIREPIHVQKCRNISDSWNIEENIHLFKNETAVKIWIDMKKKNWLLPVTVPFSIFNPVNQIEAVALFHILYSAKDYDTFYKTALYVKDRVNQDLFIYVLNALHVQRPDLKELAVPPIYEVLPEYFNNAEILTTAQRIAVHGARMVDYYSSTYKWDSSIVIRWNTTIWPYSFQSSPISYFLNDYGLNAHYFYNHLRFPFWLGDELFPLIKDRRGDWFWFTHHQIITRYYMERLSNGLGEIKELDDTVVYEGYNSGYMYHNGIPYPVRPNRFELYQSEHLAVIEKLKLYERRIRDAIDSGYIMNSTGEYVDIQYFKAFEVIARVIEAGVNTPNVNYYKDFISTWKSLLGNCLWPRHNYYNRLQPLLVPSALEHYQTALSDPAFYMIFKRVLNLFYSWRHLLLEYKGKELAVPDVVIEKVDVDKLVTFFEYSYMNISEFVLGKESVLVQYPRLNHKKFNVRIHVKSKVAKKVEVRFFLAPKYNSQGVEIPLFSNYENFFLLNYFTYELPAGESIIVRESTQNPLTVGDLKSLNEIHLDALHVVEGKKELKKGMSDNIYKFPHRLLLPKGRVGGMPFIFMVYISEPHPHILTQQETEFGYFSGEPLGVPFDRTFYQWEIDGLRNIYFQDVLIFHKPTPKIVVPYTV